MDSCFHFFSVLELLNWPFLHLSFIYVWSTVDFNCKKKCKNTMLINSYRVDITRCRISIERRHHVRFVLTGVQDRFIQRGLPADLASRIVDKDSIHLAFIFGFGVRQQYIIRRDESFIQTHWPPELLKIFGLFVVCICPG